MSDLSEIEVGDYFTMKIENGILHIKVKKDTFVELPMVQEVVAKQHEVTNGIPMLVLLDISDAFGVTKEAREFTSGKSVEGLQIAMAMLINSLPMRLLANFFIKFDKPPAPTRLFNSYDKAIEWLKNHQ